MGAGWLRVADRETPRAEGSLGSWLETRSTFRRAGRMANLAEDEGI